LREDYEYRLRYDEAGKFFIKEMELKRKYKEIDDGIEEKTWIQRNFSPIGIYFHLGKYGEDEIKPLRGLLYLFIISFSIMFIFSPYVYGSLLKAVNLPFVSTTSTSSINSIISGTGIDGNKVIEASRSAIEKTLSDFFQVNNNSAIFELSFA
jgi:hypothetical protein